ncbi:MAG: hypothetical protein HFG02_02810 [Oscillibacter sp.]|nr:hypothetical protein [Oscillibacter sp.]
MHVYTSSQWVLLFFFYCFCGWVWESCYVSVCQRRWVNRGFLHGPLLPIYGSGAILILLATIPVAEDLRLVWFFGMLAATVLEYVTGDVMERIFKVRYWDYSNQKCNLNGHICLTSSIAWGFFSILLVRFIHPPIARLLARVPALCVDPLAFVLTAAFTVDAVRSVQAALNLRDLLARAMEENEELRRLAMRAEVYAAFAGDDLRRFRERTELEKLELRQRVEEGLAERRQARAERVEASLRRRASAKLEALSTISSALETCRNHLDSLPDLTGDELERRRADLEEVIQRVRDREAAIRGRSTAAYHRSLRILRANPSAVSKEFGGVLEKLKTLGRDGED